MNNKGFTLVELLAIIIILGIIVVIAAPSITNQVQKGEENNRTILNEKIENAAKIYAAKYYASELISRENITFTLKRLQEDGLINFKDDQCKDKMGESITISKNNEQKIKYNYSLLNDTNCYSN